MRAWAEGLEKTEPTQRDTLAVLAELASIAAAMGAMDRWAGRNGMARFDLTVSTAGITGAALADRLGMQQWIPMPKGLLPSAVPHAFPARPHWEGYCEKPHAADVPVPADAMAILACHEAFCRRHEIEIPARPTDRGIATAALREQILTADKDALAGVLEKVGREDADVLEAILADAEAGTLKPVKKLAKWREKDLVAHRYWLVMRPPSVPAPAGGAGAKQADDVIRSKRLTTIRTGNLEAVHAALAKCDVTDLADLQAIEPRELRSRWRKRDVSERIDELCDLRDVEADRQSLGAPPLDDSASDALAAEDGGAGE